MTKRFFVRFFTKQKNEWGSLYAVVIHNKVRKYLNTEIIVSKTQMSEGFDTSGYFDKHSEKNVLTEMAINDFMRALNAVMERLIMSGQYQAIKGKELTRLVKEQRFQNAVREFDNIEF